MNHWIRFSFKYENKFLEYPLIEKMPHDAKYNCKIDLYWRKFNYYKSYCTSDYLCQVNQRIDMGVESFRKSSLAPSAADLRSQKLSRPNYKMAILMIIMTSHSVWQKEVGWIFDNPIIEFDWQTSIPRRPPFDRI